MNVMLHPDCIEREDDDVEIDIHEYVLGGEKAHKSKRRSHFMRAG